MPEILCPHCGKKLEYERIRDIPTFPFCSERCKLIDLGMWLEEEHKISTPMETHDRKEHQDEPE